MLADATERDAIAVEALVPALHPDVILASSSHRSATLTESAAAALSARARDTLFVADRTHTRTVKALDTHTEASVVGVEQLRLAACLLLSNLAFELLSPFVQLLGVLSPSAPAMSVTLGSEVLEGPIACPALCQVTAILNDGALTGPASAAVFAHLAALSRAFSYFADFRGAVCTAVALLCEAHEGNRATAGPSVVRLVVDILSEPDGALAQAMRATGELAGGSIAAAVCGGNINEFARVCAVPLILAGMECRLGNVEVQQWGCFALWRLSRPALMKVAIAAAGGVVSVCAALRAHPYSANVHYLVFPRRNILV